MESPAQEIVSSEAYAKENDEKGIKKKQNSCQTTHDNGLRRPRGIQSLFVLYWNLVMPHFGTKIHSSQTDY